MLLGTADLKIILLLIELPDGWDLWIWDLKFLAAVKDWKQDVPYVTT